MREKEIDSKGGETGRDGEKDGKVKKDSPEVNTLLIV